MSRWVRIHADEHTQNKKMQQTDRQTEKKEREREGKTEY